MGASAAVRGLFQVPIAADAFRRQEGGEHASPQYDGHTPAQFIKSILSQSGYTVARLSANTGRRYGRESPYFIPPTFLYKLSRGVTPHLCQLVALSETTGYRFVDCMKLCGFDLHQIPRLQMRLHTERTVLFTPIEYDTDFPRSERPEFREWTLYGSVHGSIGSRLNGPWQPDHRRYILAKIGRRDALVYPELMPGRIVRVDRCYRQPVGVADYVCLRDRLWLVEEPGGLACCRVRWLDDHQIVILPNRHPWGSLPLRLPTEARILGLVEAEAHAPKALDSRTRAGPVHFEPPLRPPRGREKMKFPDLLRVSRRRTGLTFRAAHQLTGVIAHIFANADYAISLGLLSDYETMAGLPRHIAKIIGLCIAYCIDVRELLEAAGVMIDESAKLPVPGLDHSVPRLFDFVDDAERRRAPGIDDHLQSADGHLKPIPGSSFTI